MKFERSSGILLHPTSLPGPDGIGDLGPQAYHWVDFLAETGCSLWQILPLGPTGFGDSPYQCFSAFAGNPYLISPAMLLEDGLLTLKDLEDRPNFPDSDVDFGKVIPWKIKLLDRAFQHYQSHPLPEIKEKFSKFIQLEREWLEDYVLFMAIKESQGGVSWDHWPEGLKKREPKALEAFQKQFSEAIRCQTFRQFLFFEQWKSLKTYANEKGIKIIGDIPIFVAYDSADAWSHPELFYLDEEGLPTVVAGVPPDYFAPTGQLWGNPIYRWEMHEINGFSWWIKRIKSTLKTVDIIRLDHFRGFAAYWEVPANLPTAEIGEWVPGPGASFFYALKNALGDLPIIAEDLGKITPDVDALLDQFELPGMKILQFAFSTDSNDEFLPHNYPRNCISYTGTHDNDTVLGWYQTAREHEKDFYRRYMARSGENVSWDMIQGVWASVAVFAIAPMQDFLSLGTDARMNFPGKPSGNWTWRMRADAIRPDLIRRIKEINQLYSRPVLIKENKENA